MYQWRLVHSPRHVLVPSHVERTNLCQSSVCDRMPEWWCMRYAQRVFMCIGVERGIMHDAAVQPHVRLWHVHAATDVYMRVGLGRKFVFYRTVPCWMREWRLHGPRCVHVCHGVGWLFLLNPHLQPCV